ncbi:MULTISPECIES: oligosaccharide flippase family protein [Brevibacillus]|uniref:oligosaccharide flippase family protein n=1 Tax=Brevibacillus TaxID=55080 RepID=UPI000E2E76DA|nr:MULTISPECIES: oligosaccharide flippase family protein [Brevibacillus]MBG9789906.1 teichoic acid transporter [Brevibacillus laterosporus]MCG7317001.1 oligosaccharide flippase family protein [Brevibacillus laterosporus]MED1786688.1 oligosaccharide flippase family protein [Brevibacillus laterosporus]RFB32773.1 teichoic acid transporter [Brevibacillus sp. VP]
MGLPLIIRQFLLRSGLLFLVKIIGAIGRILLFRIFGAEGMGLYQMVYAFYGFVLTLVTAGLPTSLSLSTAKDVHKGIYFLKVSIILTCILGGSATVLSYSYAEIIADWYGDSKLSVAIQLLSPVFLFVPQLHLFRGFFQGVEIYGVISFSELLEQSMRIITMLVLANLWIAYGVSVAVGGAILGAVLGGLSALLFFIGIYIQQRKKLRYLSLPSRFNHSNETSVFLKMSVSVLATRLLLPLTDFIDSILIPNRLMHSGLTAHQSTIIYGEITGMALTIVYLPSMVTSAFLHVIIPKIAGNWEKNNVGQFRSRVNKAMKVGWLWGISTSLYFFLYGQNISQAITGDGSLAYSLICLSLIPFLSGIRDISTNILWVKGRKKGPLVGVVLGAIISIIINYYLVGIPSFQYSGIVIGILSFELTSLLWNLQYMRHFLSLKILIESVIFLVLCYAFASILDSLPLFIHVVLYFGCISLYVLLRFSRRIIYM